MTLSLSEVREVCMKHPGMWDDFMTAGSVGGTTIVISRQDFEGIQRKYFGERPAGLVVHEFLKPIAAAVDSVFGTELASCGGCAGRELRISDQWSAVSGQ